MNDIAFIYFDAVGTLLFPQPSVGAVYADVGRRFGSRRDAAELAARFRGAFHRQEAVDAADGWRSSEDRERGRWRAIVAETIEDATDPEGCFAALYDHFARPDAWASPPGTGAVLIELAARGYGLGIASNFDQRLAPLVAAKPEFAAVGLVLSSARARWSKPAPRFFAAAAALAQTPPANLLFVGDDLRNDYDGARAAGFEALLLDARGQCQRRDVCRITSLAELLDCCPRRR